MATTTKLFPGIKRATELVFVKGQGSRVTCASGRDYLDFTSGIGVTSTGHCHPRVVAAVRAQAGVASHLQMSIGYHDRMLELIERLEPYTMGLDSFFFSNSGGEAIEGALRLARQATGRPGVIAFQGGYHGRTAGALAVTSSSVGYRGRGAGPLPYGSFFAPYPYRAGNGGFNVASTWVFSKRFPKEKHPRFELAPRDDRSSKNEPKRVENDRDTSLQSWEFLTLFPPRREAPRRAPAGARRRLRELRLAARADEPPREVDDRRLPPDPQGQRVLPAAVPRAHRLGRRGPPHKVARATTRRPLDVWREGGRAAPHRFGKSWPQSATMGTVEGRPLFDPTASIA